MKNKILIGDVFPKLKEIPSGHVNTCVTSPPYWGLRDYGVDGQIGLEKTPEEFIDKMVFLFREVKRVLRDDGTLWLNLGDSYCSTAPGTMGDKLNQRGILSGVSYRRAEGSRRHIAETSKGLKPKDLVGIPWRVALALQDDGWYLRQDIIWHKPNPMPESVRDRCTKSHEYIFLLSKSQKYYYDYEAIKEPTDNIKGNANGFRGGSYCNGNTDNSTMGTRTQKGNKKRGHNRDHEGFRYKWDSMSKEEQQQFGRNKRSVWTVATKPFPGAHFATFPPDLIEPCILAGCPVGGIVLDPFFGSGTTGEVSMKTARNYIGIELNPVYAEMSENRLKYGIVKEMDLKEAKKQFHIEFEDSLV